MAQALPLYSNKYQNNTRTVKSGEYVVTPDDSVILVNTAFDSSSILHTTTLDLCTIPTDKWDTMYKLYVSDIGNSASTYPITILAPTGFLINGATTITINTDNGGVLIRILNNTNYIAEYNSSGGNGISSIPVKNTVYVMKNGVDATGLVERFDKPFLTFAGARDAILHYWDGTLKPLPSATNRILVVVESGYYQEQIILDDYVDFDLNDAVIEASGIDPYKSFITDASQKVNSIVYGQATLLVGSDIVPLDLSSIHLYGIFIGGGGDVTINFKSMTTYTKNGAGVRGILVNGGSVANITFDTINIVSKDGGANTVGILSDELATKVNILAKGDIYIEDNNGYMNGVCALNSYINFNGRNVTVSGCQAGSVANTISAQLGGILYANCNNLYHLQSQAGVSDCSAVFCGLGSYSELYLKCNKVIAETTKGNGVVCFLLGRTLSSNTTTGAKMYVECQLATISAEGSPNSAIVTQDCDSTTTASFKGIYQVTDTGLSVATSCVYINSDSVARIIFDCATLISQTSSLYSITGGLGKKVYIYGSVQANVVIDSTNIALLVGTQESGGVINAVNNGRFLVSADVLAM